MILCDIEGIRISLIDPDKLISQSKGEVQLARTFELDGRPILKGLFCERVFGTMNPGTCLCGVYHKEYKKKKLKCAKCQQYVLREWEKRKRYGIISVETPVVHIWYRSIIATLLCLPPRKLRDVINCSAFVVVDPGETEFAKHQIISASECNAQKRQNKKFLADTGGAVLQKLLRDLDVRKLVEGLRRETPSRRTNKRLQIARDFLLSGVKPQWMVMTVIPVMHPHLRPILFMEDGTVASSDVNDLYARVINRNNRLRVLKEMGAPARLRLIEMRLLQGAVDALFHNAKDYTAKDRSKKRTLKSLTDLIDKKQGRMRRNLLGKRVDYSGRSVIVPGPTLRLNQVGLPMSLALDMFRPFVYGNLMRKGFAPSLKHASFLADLRRPETIDALEEEMKERVVILNRAPSLHRMSVQAFDPVLVEGKAIRLHPLVCTAFNADFDGDQMAVHLPVSLEAQIEARVLMLSVNNLLSPANGKLIMTPAQDIVLGIYYLTKDRRGVKGEGKSFSDKEQALWAHSLEGVHLQAKITVRIAGQLLETTPGRLIFSELFPAQVPFESVNKTIRKKDLAKLIEMCHERDGQRETVILLDRIKETGFKYATLSGISFCTSDISIPKEKKKILEKTDEDVEKVKAEYRNGLISETERYNRIIALWEEATREVSGKMMENLGIGGASGLTEEQKRDMKEFNNMFIMADSGARGAIAQISQVGGMRGLMAKTTGEVVEIPIKSNLREGLTYHEYLLASHGARKGRADGALKTKNAGYFTRRLADAAHDVIVEEYDCGTILGITMSPLVDNDQVVLTLEDRIMGRTAAEDVRNPVTARTIVKRNDVIDKTIASEIQKAEIPEVKVRSPFSCKARKGVCSKCYGLDLSTGREVSIGEAVGIIAAQSIGEPGTQLTLRTFHSGGSAEGMAKKSSISANKKGTVKFQNVRTVTNIKGKEVAVSRGGRIIITAENGKDNDVGTIPYGSVFEVREGATVEMGEKIIEWDPYNNPVISVTAGKSEFIDISEGLTVKKEINEETGISQLLCVAIHDDTIPRVKIGEKEYMIPIGAILTVDEGEEVHPGHMIAKVPKQASKTSDITGGLPKVLQILEVRDVENAAVIAEIGGTIKINPPKGKYMTVDIVGEGGEEADCSISTERQLNVLDGDTIMTGDIIAEGPIDVKDILRVYGPEKAALFVVNEVQKVYLSQGVSINDKHFELMARKMLGFVKVQCAGDTDLVADDILLKSSFEKTNGECHGRKAIAEPVILGLGRSAINSESWLSAASFERTASVLAHAAIRARVDDISGLKENVLLGRKVPAGTGHPYFLQTRLLKKRRRHD